MIDTDKTLPRGAGEKNGVSHYLRPDTNIELLRCRWYAWQHTMSPVQHALNLAFRQVPLMESFISDPEMHVEASSQPELLGGPYIDLPVSSVEGIRNLLATIRSECGNLLMLAEDVRSFMVTLPSHAEGGSPDKLYASLPVSLRGVVEIVYDAGGSSSIKIREELLMEDLRYRCSMEEVALTRTPDKERNFFINTPKVPSGDDVFLPMAFASPSVKILADARLHPIELESVSSKLGLDVSDLAPFFTTDAPVRNAPSFHGEGVRIRYFGHASVAVQSSQTTVLLDPRYAFERDDSLASLTFYDLPDVVDYVFLSHAHQDHFCAETLCQLRHRVGKVLVPRNSRGSITDPSMKVTLRSMGFSDIQSLDDLDKVTIPGGYIVSIPFPGEHGSLDIQSKQCALIVIEGRRFLFLVDSDATDVALYARLKTLIGDVDALFIGMECDGAPVSWLYGPLLAKSISRQDDDSRRGNGSDCEKAWSVIKELKCSTVYIYAMGMEPWNDHLLGLEYAADSLQIVESDKLISRCIAAGIHAERLKGCREFFFAAQTTAREEVQVA